MSKIVGFSPDNAQRVANATIHVERMLRGGPGPGPRGGIATPFPLIMCGGPSTAIAAATLSGSDVLPGTGTLRKKIRTEGSGIRYEPSSSSSDDITAENPYTTESVPATAHTVWVTPWQGGYVIVAWECP
jgi:hypothetical protein